MVNNKENFQKELIEIKSKLSDMHNDLKLFFEQSNQLHNESVISGIQRDFSNVIMGHVKEYI